MFGASWELDFHALRSKLYLHLHGVEFSATDVAEVPQWIFTVGGHGLHLLARQIFFRVSADDVS